MNNNKFLILLAVIIVGIFVNPVIARRCDTALIAYDRWIVEDYRYQSWNTPDSARIADRQYIRQAEKDVVISEYGDFRPVEAIFDAFRWVSESVGSVFGVQSSDPYRGNP